MDCQETIEKFRQTLIRAQNASDRAHETLDRLQAAECHSRREGNRLRGETDKRLQRTVQLSASLHEKPRRAEALPVTPRPPARPAARG